jgi:hypothetical protein
MARRKAAAPADEEQDPIVDVEIEEVAAAPVASYLVEVRRNETCPWMPVARSTMPEIADGRDVIRVPSRMTLEEADAVADDFAVAGYLVRLVELT